MDADSDHYIVLGLPSGEEGAKLTVNEIRKAYCNKALELHPDKRPDDPDADAKFVGLKIAYDILKDEKSRKHFDDLIRAREEKNRRLLFRSSKRQKMISELEERERRSSSKTGADQEGERIAAQFQQEVTGIRAMFHNKRMSPPAPPTSHKETSRRSKGSADQDGSISSSADKEKMLKVYWEKAGKDYSAERLREIFGEFGKVEDVVILSGKEHKRKNRSSALVVMASKDAAVAATGNVLGDLSNPLLVLPLYPGEASAFPAFSGACRSNVKPEEPPLMSEFGGAGYHAFEEFVLGNMKRKAAEKQSG